MKEAIAFYTGVLDFTLKDPYASPEDSVINLVIDDVEIQLTTHESKSLFGSVINLRVDDVDGLFKKYIERGLDISGKENSHAHQGPINQSWGMREFYVTDTDGNTLRFGKPFDLPKAFYKNAWPYKDDKMNLPVKDVKSAVEFYTGVMNFHVASHKDNPYNSIVLGRDAIQIALAENGGDPTQEGCFFEVDNVETALRELQLNGFKKDLSALEMHKHGDTEWKVFFVVAPDGLCYCIGEKQ